MTISKLSKNSWWPRPYMSWSQFEKWTSSPNEYVRHYCPSQCRSCGTELWRPDWEGGRCHTCGQPVLSEWTNAAMQIGLQIASMLEADEPQEDPKLELYRTFIPKPTHHEFAINRPFAGIRFVGKLDGWTPKTMTIDEYKTGRDWSQQRADRHRQLDFYQLLIWLLYGKLADRIRLIWLPTRFDIGIMAPELTGEIVTFDTMRTKQDAMRMASDTIKARAEIGMVCGALPMPDGYPMK